MSLRSTIVCQFGKPSGLLGKLAGFIMSHRQSNIERIEWAISLLDHNINIRLVLENLMLDLPRMEIARSDR